LHHQLQVFVSHSGADTGWAEWTAWHMEAAGYAVELDRWDWGAGANFVTMMNAALRKADVVVALWSAAYFEPGRFTEDEWTAVAAARARLVPLRVEEVTPPNLLQPLIWRDLFGKDEETAAATLLEAVQGPSRPADAPAFPGLGEGTGKASDRQRGPRLPGVLPPVWNVPARVGHFTGRDALLARLRERLAGDSGPMMVQAVRGAGGVGKTSLAIEFTHRFAHDFSCVWWVDAEQPELIGQQLTALAVAAGLVSTEVDILTGEAKALAWLRQSSRWLIIFDNAADPADIRRWLPGGPGRVLVTSRDPRWAQAATDAVEVDIFTRAESTDLLGTLLPSVSAGDAAAVADVVGDLPLAVAQAAGFMAETGMAASDYVNQIWEHAADTLAEGTPASYPRPLAAVVTVALHQVESEDPAAADLLRVCAFMAPAPIPLRWFALAAVASTLPASLRTVAGNAIALHRSAGRLSRYGLARIVEDGLLFHRLTSAICRDTMNVKQWQAIRAIAQQMLVKVRPGNPEAPGTWELWASLLPHIIAIDVPAAASRALLNLACKAAWYLLVRGDARAGLDLATRLYDQWLPSRGPDDDYVLRAVNSRARAFRELGQYQQAKQLDEESLTRRREVFGPDHRTTLAVANSLGVSLRDLREYDSARHLDEDTLSRLRRILGEDHPHTLTSANNLARDLQALGEVSAARALDEETLARRRRVLGEDHPDTLRSRRNLASDLRESGQPESALMLDRDVLARSRQVMGEDHRDTLRVASGLAADMRDLGRFHDALALDEDTLARSRKVLGDNHPWTREFIQNVLTDLRALGRDADAESLEREAAHAETGSDVFD
jgi:tetratricopeptide (TPR) repeat protein